MDERDKLLAAQSRDMIGLTQGSAKDVGDMLEPGVTDIMALGTLDPFALIDIKHGERCLALLLPPLAQ
uniref:hypothetical protein n=1 Tax=uncultured Maricaulis sp. TaxID=174710 RepID=UPI0030DCEDB3